MMEVSNENGKQDNVGHVEVTIHDDEIAALREAFKAWDQDGEEDKEAWGWRYARDLSPDQYLVMNWAKMVDWQLLKCDHEHRSAYQHDAQFRITSIGRNTLKAIDQTTKSRIVTLEDEYNRGRADAEREMQQQLYALFGDDCNWHEASNVPAPLKALKVVQYAQTTFKTRTRNVESALETRDKVDAWAAHLLDWAAEAHVANHGERRGHMTLVAALLRRYVGARNTQPTPPDPSGIPF